MKPFPYLGPSLVVLIAGGVAIVSTPLVVRRVNDARADEQIVQAAHVLAQAGLPDERLALTQEGARDPLAGDHPLPSGASADPARATGGEPILEQINRANRAIARLVEPSVVHVSAQNAMQRRSFVAPYASSGSGWIWDDAGHIVTNAHVVDGAQRLQVQFFDGELRDAELVGLDLRTDIAVIKVDAGGLHPARRGDSASVEQGDMVFAFGSPFDFRFSMSAGIVSGLGRSTALDNIDYQNFIQTDAAINPGNSGGPLTDVRGRVIGMNTAIATGRGATAGSGQFAGIGLAIPMAIVENVVAQLIDHGAVSRGFLGVQVIDSRRMRAGGPRGAAFDAVRARFPGDAAVIAAVTRGSPADAAGLRAGDVILAVGGRRIEVADEVLSEIGSRRPGAELALEVWRAGDDGAATEGTRLPVTVRLATLDPSANAPGLVALLARAGLSGLADASRRGRRGVEVGRADGPVAADIPSGSMIVAVDGLRVASLDDLWVRLGRGAAGRVRILAGPGAVLTVLRPDGSERDVDVPLR